MVEHPAVNRKVIGSNPVRRVVFTINKKEDVIEANNNGEILKKFPRISIWKKSDIGLIWKTGIPLNLKKFLKYVKFRFLLLKHR